MLEFNLDQTPETFSHRPVRCENEGNFPFVLVDTGYMVVGSQHYTRRENVDNYLLLVTVEGRGRVTWKNQSVVLEPGMAVLMDSNLLHDYRTVGEGWKYRFLHFRSNCMDGYAALLLETLTPVRLQSPENTVRLMQEVYMSSFSTDIYAPAIRSGLITHILSDMVNALAGAGSKKTQNSRKDIQMLAQFISENASKPLHLEDFTEQIRLSKHHLIRLFERQIGMTPYRYMHMCRIGHAKFLLRTTDQTVTQIAYAVGYNDPMVFIRHFKSFNQITPNVFRSKLKNAGTENEKEPGAKEEKTEENE